MAPISTRPRAARLSPEARRAAIVEAVQALVSERGPGVTTAELAEAAQVSEGTIFHAFDDKDSLIEAVLESALDGAPIEQAIAEIDRALALEARLVAATQIIQSRVRETWRLLAYRYERTPPKAAEIEPVVSGALEALMAEAGSRLRVSPSEAASTLRWMAIASAHPMMSRQRISADAVVDRFLHGCMAAE